MKSIKPGRGPSMMGGVIGIFVALFGVVWTALAASMGGGVFALFGVIFVVIAVIQVVYNFKNATGENRFSSFDITDSSEESDPFNEKYGKKQMTPDGEEYVSQGDLHYCPYCGARRENDFDFCPKCGKPLPK